ncbi:MAG: flagellar biosynthesis protein FlhB [Rhodospirillaceae bacterium]
MSEDKDAKTEQPTGKRLGKARDEGNIPMSQEVKSTAMLVGALIVVGVLSPWVATDLGAYLRGFIERPETIQTDIESIRTLFVSVLWHVGILMAFPMAVLVVMAFVGTTGQVGLVYTPKKLSFNLGNLSPIAGFKRMFSLNAVLEMTKGLVKIFVVGGIVSALVIPTMGHPDKIIDQDLGTTLSEIHRLLVMIIFITVLVMTTLAAADYIYQHWSHREKLKMTKQEVKDEHKEQDGDPKVKGRIRSLRIERHRQRMMVAVSKANVIITNPTHFAVALKYDMEAMAAPVVVGKGIDYLAKRMRQVAEIHEVPIIENPPLARALYASVEIDQEIPQEHYKAVAEVIGFVMRLKGKRVG